MKTVTARQAVPGTRIIVPSTRGWGTVTVKRWEGRGNGYASLLGVDNIYHGQYKADEVFELASSRR